MWSVDFAQEDEAEQILDVQKKAFSENQKHYDTLLPALREQQADVQREIGQGRVLVARQGGRVIGTARFQCHESEVEVYFLAVDPAYTHLAAGRSLLTRIEEEAIKRNVKRVVFSTGLLDAPAIEFFTRSGYRPYALQVDEDGDYDQIRFQKVLANT